MVILLLIISALAIVHFIYQGIMLPSIRLALRYRVFELRDKLRKLAINNNVGLDTKAYEYMQEAINVTTTFLYRFDLKLALDVHQAFKQNPSLYELAENRHMIIKSCKSQELHRIDSSLKRILALVLLANSGGFIFFLIPLLLLISAVLSAIHQFKKQVWDRVRDFVASMMCVPEKEVSELTSMDYLSLA